jgi:hypothetical protein
MVARAKYGLGLIAVGALASALAPLAGATLEQATSASATHPNAIIAALKGHGKINGAIYAVQPNSELKARVRISLHHLAPATSYGVAASTTGCSHTATTSSRAFRLVIKTSASRDDAFKATATPLSKPVTNAKSLRIYRQGSDGKFHQTECYAPGNATVMVTDDD